MHFHLPAIVTEANAMQLERDGLTNLAALKVIDCSDLKDFDSTVLAVLLAWQKRLQADGMTLKVERPPEKLKVLANVYGVSGLLGI
ncbi:MAG: STAS domain-containing protein [Polynucleobacter sp.]|jgi:phospholipid transport system transporter-binding protein|uniref:STAS domain-containing protein n=1 Tax=Polynucleobacter sp. TaxID=2029855 RepID=UPI002173A375|nr:STAS domain-containing protein [Polynucleobacter sp.]MBU3669222.1 STAS domain-containing protein [Polynucleobacter sp.]MCW1965572.1 STAS domain-containing protein [Polynucleobacter sp.]